MTPIQALSLPEILKGTDLIAQAKTGSGKTAAFGIGILSQINVQADHVQALILCPTRELADQVAKEMRALARMIPNVRVLTLCGGVPLSVHANQLEKKVHIAVGTPGRVEDLLQKKKLTLDKLNLLVLDEADRMLDMGFQDSIDLIVSQTNKQRQTLLFSATFPEKIQLIAKRVMTKPVKVEVDTSHDESSIQQSFFNLDEDEKFVALKLLLLEQRPPSTLVFCNTKQEADYIAEQLQEDGFSALALHGDFEQRQRRDILVQFANKSISVLVATDVAARGLDINKVDVIINYDIARDPEVHTHRVGRTGRAGSTGKAYSFYTDRDDYQIKLIEENLGENIKPGKLPPQNILKSQPYQPTMATLQINGGKSHKICPGDIVGALTAGNGIEGKDIGDIDIFDRRSYVAIKKKFVKQALNKLNDGKIKGRSFKVSLI